MDTTKIVTVAQTAAVALDNKLDGKKRILAIAILGLSIAATKIPGADTYLTMINMNTDTALALIGGLMGLWGWWDAIRKGKLQKVVK